MKSALVILSTIVIAKDNHGFPDDDWFNTSCRLSTTLKGISCQDAKNKAIHLIAFNDGIQNHKDPLKKDVPLEHDGNDEIKEEDFFSVGNNWIRSTGRTYYTKDLNEQLFEF